MQLVRTNSQGLSERLQQDGLRMANLVHEALKRHPRLSQTNKDGSIFAPRVAVVQFPQADNGVSRFMVLIMDPEAMYHFPMKNFDAQALFMIRTQLQKPVRRISAATLLAMYPDDLRPDQAEDMVAYAVDLIPQKRQLPGLIDLPAQIVPGHLMIGTDARQQIGGTGKDLQSIMVAGESGSGKSTLLRSLAYQAGQHGWTVYLAEPDTSHTWQQEAWLRLPGVVSVQHSEQGILGMIGQIGAEVEHRSKLFSLVAAQNDGIPPEDIYEYNQMTGQNMQPILLGIDEYLDFRYGQFADLLEEAARKYRKFGLVLLIAAHNWQSSSIPSSFGSLLHTRICLKVNDPNIGAATLHRNYHYGKQAAGLTGKGRGLTLINGRLTEFQCYHLDKERIKAAMKSNPVSVTEEVETDVDGIDWALVTEMVRWAMDEQRNGSRGKFTVRGVGEVFKDRLNQRAFTLLAQKLEARQYLTPNQSSTGRCIKPELLRKVGLA
jgi:hypothetical protein